jgi:CSLREA domain-containing protein
MRASYGDSCFQNRLIRDVVLRAGFTLLALCAIGAARASTVICVPTEASLTSAIQQANDGPEGSAWEIRIRKGTYNLTDSLIFEPDGDHDNKSFTMTGGWSGPSGACQDPSADPSTTVIHGIAPDQNTFGTDIQLIGDNARYDIEYIRFENFSEFLVDDGYCYDGHICPDTDSIYLAYNEFSNGELVHFNVQDAKKVTFRNNLVTKMNPVYLVGSTVDFAPVGFYFRNNEDGPQISFNTFADITCEGATGAVQILSHNTKVALHHNIIQSTGCIKDLYIDPAYGGQTVTPYYNLFSNSGGLVGGNLADDGNVLNFNPMFVDAFNGDYRLAVGSPAINKGETLLGAAQDIFIVSIIDLDGKFRPIGTRFDIGAFESGVVDGTPAVLTVNTNDDVDNGDCTLDHCSLREAINRANSQLGTPQRIAFNISGSCPQLIVLGSALPDITDSVWINGSSQPGSAQNDQDLGSDAHVCILIGPGASMNHAIGVPVTADTATRLTVDGLGFGNSFYAFSTAPIELRSGSGHKISGSVFGGYLPPGNNPTQVGSLGRAIYMSGTAKNVTIGGPANADRNYFGSMGQNGIVMNSAGNSGVTIQNNYIGVQPNGLGAQANSAEGIGISGGTNGTIVDNAICASGAGIALIGTDTTGFTIQRNNIGVNAAGYGVAAHANDVGISIGLGSNNHIIGAAPLDDVQPGTYSNFIDNNNGDGILVTSNVSNNTVSGFISMRGNLIDGNGRSGTGVGIDLGGSQTQFANDSGDADAGANTLQNYPIIKGTTPNGALTLAVRSVLNTLPNQPLHVDVYYGATCNPARGANATTLIGGTDVNSGATGLVSFAATVVNPALPGFLTATATTASGHTSELAPCVRTDTIFTDGLQKPGL